jgi:hypothetical protein
VQLNQCYSLIPFLFYSCGLVLPALSWFCLLSLSVSEFLEESSVVVASWSHIVLVSAYRGRLIASSILNVSFAG